MTAVFISHASADGGHASQIKAWLNERGFENVFLDLDKVGGIGAGENWERRLYEEVARCHAVILIVTPAWLNSKWCFAEFSMARSLGKVIFPILLRADDIKMIGPELGSIQIEQWDDHGQEHLAERLNSVAHEIARGHRYLPDRPPYPGFLSFDRRDAAVFFGRDPEVRQISERLEARRVQGGARLLMVVGPSGSGKSSVVKAGVLPWIGRDARRWVVVPPFRPGEAPITRLAKALSAAMKSDTGWKHLRDKLIEAPGAVLGEIADLLVVGEASEATVLIPIDQFEEAFALPDDSERGPFLKLLSAISGQGLPVMVIATVRSDLMGEILKSQGFSVPHEVFTLGQLPVERLPQVIEGPAQVAAIQLEPGLTQRIIDDAISADALPLLAFALREMHDRYGGDGRLTILRYEALGDPAAGLSPLENAIRRKAEETIANAAPGPAELDALKEAFVAGLVRLNEEGVRLRRSARLEDLPEAARPLAERLIEARLLSARGEGDERVIEVAHEALFRAWPQLAKWLDDEQDFLIGRRHIEDAYQIWAETPEAQKDRALLTGLLLERARGWMLAHPARLAETRDFVLASIRKEERETARARRRQLSLTISAVVAAIVFGVLGLAASLQWSRAESAAERAETEAERAHRNELAAAAASREAEQRFSLALGAVAAGLAEEDPRLALYLAAEAVARDGARAPGFYARAAMIAARQQLATDGPHLLGSPIPVGDALSLAFSPEGDTIAVGDRNGILRLIPTGRRAAEGDPIDAHTNGIEDLAFDPDGDLLASASADGDVRLWQIEDGKIVRGTVIERFGDVAWSVGFDRTGRQLAASSETGVVGVWEVGGGAPVSTLRLKGEGDMLSVAFSPDGGSLLAGTGSGRIYGWWLASGSPIFPVITGAHGSDVWQIRFTPSGERFATVSSDGSSALFAYPGAQFLSYPLEKERMIQSAAFGRDGEVLIGGSAAGRLHLRDLSQDGAVRVSVPGHAGRIAEIELDARGTRLASLGRDQNVRLWTLFDPAPVSTDFTMEAGARGVAISADGSTVAGADKDGALRIFRGTGGASKRLEGHSGQVWALALSSDGRRLASADRDGHLRVHDLARDSAQTLSGQGEGALWWLGYTPDGGRLIAAGDDGVAVFDAARDHALLMRLQEGDRLTGAAVSPDGDRLATAGADGTVTLFDIASGERLGGLRVIEDIVWNVAFSPDGGTLAVAGSDESVSLWDSGSWQRRAELGGHGGGATDLAFLPGGATLAVSDRRGQLHLWDVATGRRLAPAIAAHGRASWRLEAAADAPLFVTSGDDGKVRLWNVLDGALACRLGAPAFDSQRRREYFGEAGDVLACQRRDGKSPLPADGIGQPGGHTGQVEEQDEREELDHDEG